MLDIGAQPKPACTSTRNMRLGGDTNDTARRAGACVTGLLGLGVATLAEIVGAGVYDDGALYSYQFPSAWKGPRGRGRERGETHADDAVLADELDQLVGGGALCVALAVCLEVAQVADVAVLIGGRAVLLAVGVDFTCILAFLVLILTQPRVLTVGAGRGAAVGVVAEGVDVHAALSVGIVAGDVPRDGGGGALVLLLEGDGALDVGVTAEDSDYTQMSAPIPFQYCATRHRLLSSSGGRGGAGWPSRSPVAARRLVSERRTPASRPGTPAPPAWSSSCSLAQLSGCRCARRRVSGVAAYKTCSISLGQLGRVPRVTHTPICRTLRGLTYRL
jgi:hypothetical protein